MKFLLIAIIGLAAGCSESIISCDDANKGLKEIILDPSTTFGTTSNRRADIEKYEAIIKECKKSK
jgi:hypothetical protein